MLLSATFFHVIVHLKVQWGAEAKGLPSKTLWHLCLCTTLHLEKELFLIFISTFSYFCFPPLLLNKGECNGTVKWQRGTATPMSRQVLVQQDCGWWESAVALEMAGHQSLTPIPQHPQEMLLSAGCRVKCAQVFLKGKDESLCLFGKYIWTLCIIVWL